MYRSSNKLGVKIYSLFIKLVLLSSYRDIGESWGQLLRIVRVGILWILGWSGVVGVGVSEVCWIVGEGIGGVASLGWIEEGVGEGGGAGSAHRDLVSDLDGGVRVI